MQLVSRRSESDVWHSERPDPKLVSVSHPPSPGHCLSRLVPGVGGIGAPAPLLLLLLLILIIIIVISI